MNKNRKRKTFEELNVIDDFLMNAVASDPKVGKPFCRSMLSVLLQRKIGDVSVQIQSVFQGDAPELRGIRLDVEVNEALENAELGTNCCIYDIEPQNRQVDNLPKRSRFYQAKLDGKNLEVGEEDWGKLPNLYIIMITNYDPFGEGYMMYTVRNKFEELPDKVYDDGLTFIYFNTEGTIGGNDEIQALLKYLKRSIMDNVTNATTQEIHDCVEHVKQSARLRGKYMTIGEILKGEREDGFQDGLEEGYRRGDEDGFQRGKIAGVCEGMRIMGLTDDEIRLKLLEMYSLSETEAAEILKAYCTLRNRPE